jgi:hypothetical protein
VAEGFGRYELNLLSMLAGEDCLMRWSHWGRHSGIKQKAQRKRGLVAEGYVLHDRRSDTVQLSPLGTEVLREDGG